MLFFCLFLRVLLGFFLFVVLTFASKVKHHKSNHVLEVENKCN